MAIFKNLKNNQRLSAFEQLWVNLPDEQFIRSLFLNFKCKPLLIIVVQQSFKENTIIVV